MCPSLHFLFFFFNDTATTEIYTLSLHDALPIYQRRVARNSCDGQGLPAFITRPRSDPGEIYGLQRRIFINNDIAERDRKSTRLNSSHANISYAVFCLKKKTHITSRDLTSYFLLS